MPRRKVSFTYLSLPTLEAAVAEETQVQLRHPVQQLPSSEVYDDNNNYLPEITERAYLQALEKILESAANYYTTDEITLSLNYTDGRWRLIMNTSAQSPSTAERVTERRARMNDDLDSMNDLDSILAEFGGSAPQEEAPATPAAAEEPTPQPVSEPEAQEENPLNEKPDEETHLWKHRERAAAARPVHEPKPAHMPMSAAPAQEKRNDAPRAGDHHAALPVCSRRLYCCGRSSTSTPPQARSRMPPAAVFSACPISWTYASNNAASDALGELAYIKKIYTLQENDTVSPVPNPANFGTTNDPADIREVIKSAADLLDGQSVIFDENADFVPGEPILYYLDDTILVITWKEYINQRCCTCAEVKVAHGSQLRRKLAEDSYSSSVQLYASDMAKQANAVVAINGDFYAFRDLGITVYQRTPLPQQPHQGRLLLLHLHRRYALRPCGRTYRRG